MLSVCRYITNPEADRLARELSERTGESLTDAAIVVSRERLDRTLDRSVEDRVEAATAVARRAAKRIGKMKFAPKTSTMRRPLMIEMPRVPSSTNP